MRTKKYIGAAIRSFRKAASMRQQQLADATGLARTTIVAIEKDQRGVYENELELFERALFLDAGTLSNENVISQRSGRQPVTRVHVYMGYRTGEPEPDEKCFYCDEKAPRMFYTYFGAPLCASCWDGWWRTETDDGKTDPPSAEIINKESGFWI